MTTDQHVEVPPSVPPAPRGPTDIAATRSGFTDLEQQARAFIRQRPVAAVLAAVGAGYLVARFVARGRR